MVYEFKVQVALSVWANDHADASHIISDAIFDKQKTLKEKGITLESIQVDRSKKRV